jgi:hypothetical protein
VETIEGLLLIVQVRGKKEAVEALIIFRNQLIKIEGLILFIIQMHKLIIIKIISQNPLWLDLKQL